VTLDEAEAPLERSEDVPPVSAERLVDGRLADSEGDRPAAAETVDGPRRYPSTIGGAFYLVVLAVAVVGMGVIVWGDWRTGIRWIGAALVFGALVRLVLPSRDAGMLAVRSKPLDALMLAGVGVALFLLAASIPQPPG
jgi:hypothetical protein